MFPLVEHSKRMGCIYFCVSYKTWFNVIAISYDVYLHRLESFASQINDT